MKRALGISLMVSTFLMAETGVLETITVEGETISSDTVETTAGATRGYESLTVDSATKTRTSLKQIPKSVQVINREMMDDQKVQSVSEALHNSSGVVSNNPLVTSGWESTLVRGFAAEQLQDGISLVNNMGDRESMINIERIEVLKGPNAILYGGNQGTPSGGSVNLISKMPENTPFAQLGVTIGSDNLIKPSFDINEPLNETVLLRVTGEYTKSESQIDVLERKSYNFNPTLKVKIEDDTTLTLQGKISKWKGQDYQGLPAVGTLVGDFKIDKNLFIGDKEIPDSTSSLKSMTMNVEHRLDDIWSLNVKAYAANSEYDQRMQMNLSNEPMMGSTFMLMNTRMYTEQQNRGMSVDAKADFSTDTKFIFGVETSSLDDKGFMDNMGMASGINYVDLTNPVYTTSYVDENRDIWSGEVKNRTSSAYMQMQQTLWDRLHVLVSTKLSKVVVDFEDNWGGDATTNKTKLLMQGGVVFDINEYISLFTSYSEGIKGVGWSNYTEAPKPIESKQYEAGIKFETSAQLSGSVALFKIERKNTIVADPSTGGLTSIPNGEEESKGAELDIIWQPTANFSLLSNYTNTDAKYTKDVSSTILSGNKLAGVPEHSGRMWANYKFSDANLKGFSLGAGIYTQSDSMLSGEDTYKVPGYSIYDAKIGYVYKAYETSFVVKNLTDKDYYERYDYNGGRVAPGIGRTYIVTFNVTF